MNLLITQNSQNVSHTHSEESAGSHSHTTNSLTNNSGTAITKTGVQDANHTHGMQHYHTKGDMRIQGTMQNVQFVYDSSVSGVFSASDNGPSAWSGSGQACKKVTFDTNNTNAWTGKTSGSQTSNGGGRTSTDNQSADHAHNFEHKHSTDSQGSHTHTINSSGGTEVRPVDYTYKIWKRTA